MTTPTITIADLPVLGTVQDTSSFPVSTANLTQQVSATSLKQYMSTLSSLSVSGAVSVGGATTLGSLITSYVNAATIGNIGATLTGTLSTASQTNITTVGSLTGLTVNGTVNINSGPLNAAGGISTTQVSAITLGNTGTTLTGTLSSGPQNNITSATSVTAVGTLTGLSVSGTVQPTSNAAVNLGGTTSYWNNFYSATATHNSVTVGGQGITNAGLQTVGGTLTVTGAATLNGGLTTSTVQASTIGNTGTTLTGTISTANQPNISNIGTLGNLTVSNTITSQTIFTNGFFWQANGIPVSFGSGGGGGGGNPVGNNQSIQFNNNGVFGGAASFYYFNANGVVAATSTTPATSTSTGAGNLTLNGGAINLTPIGSGAVNAGSAISIPTVVTDAYGRVVSLTANSVSTTYNLTGTNGTGSVNGGGTITFATGNGLTSTVIGSTITLSTPQDVQTTANPIFAGVFAPIKTNAQPYITSVGTLTALNVSGDAVVGGNLYIGGNTTTVNANTVTTKDLLFVAASNAATQAAANGAGIATPYSGFTYSSASTGWSSNVGITITSGAFNGSGSGLTSIPAGNLTGTIPSAVLGNSSFFIGTTAIPLNRTGSSQLLNGVNIDGTAAKLTTARNINGVAFDGSADITVTAAAGTLTGTALPSTVTGIPGTITGLTMGGNIAPSANVTYNLGSTTAWWNVFYGKASQAQYADLAEKYVADKQYAPGTVVIFGGEKEITVSDVDHDYRVAGVISTDPAYLMNSHIDGLPVALSGRVPCFVQGPINKGDRVVSIGAGKAGKLDRAKYEPGCVIGHALETITDDQVRVIEVVVGKY
jgi:hypothetical protein